MALRFFWLLLPTVLFLGGAGLLLSSVASLSTEHKVVATLIPYLLTAVAAILGYTFNRSRIVLASLNLCAAFALVQTGLQTSLNKPDAFVLFSILSILLPVNMAFIAIYRERGLITPIGLIRILFVLSGYGGLYLLWQNGELGYYLPQLPMLMLEMTLHEHFLSEAAAIAFAVSLLPIAASLYFRKTHTDAALLGCLLAAGIMLVWFNQPLISALFISAALIALCTSVVQNSYNMAYLDELTGIPARRALMDKFSTLGRRYTVAMMDVDHFKKFNDTYGHDIGDQVLRMVASQINKVRGGGKAFRYGGEEFTVVFPGKSEQEAWSYLEEVRESIAHYSMHIRSGERPKDNEQGRQMRNHAPETEIVSVKISIGACQKDDSHENPMMVLKGADQALYAAKENGRNCTILAHFPPESNTQQKPQSGSQKDFAR